MAKDTAQFKIKAYLPCPSEVSRREFKLKESTLPETTFLQVRHWHQGNSTLEERAGIPFTTAAYIRDRETGVMLGHAVAKCSPKDTPDRKKGRMIAVGRALKMVFQKCPERFFRSTIRITYEPGDKDEYITNYL